MASTPSMTTPIFSTTSQQSTPITIARFSAVDYVLFVSTLLISAGIGVYYAIKNRGNKQTTKEVLLGNKKLGIIPVALTLAGTFLSAVSLLGYPAEIYQYSTMFCYYGLMYFVAYPIAAYVFLPIFYRLDIQSCYEYLELRFHRWVRLGASSVFTVQVLLYMAVVLYAPALALSSVTDLPMVASVLTTGLVATFYTSIGGAKAVVWTNTIQLVLILSGLLAVVIGGSIHVGGMSRIWALAEQGSRIQFSDFRLDPTVRHSFWSLMIGGTFMILTLFAANQMSIQRYLSMPKLRSAQIALLCNIPLNLIALIFYTLAGLTMYATYHDCDPRKSGSIQRPDQLLPYFVMDKLGYAIGLPGLFVSAIYGAGLSTLAGGYNALAAVVLTDFVKPAYQHKKNQPMEDSTAARISKFLACGLGCISIGLAFLFSLVQSTVLQIALSIFGMAGGPILGTFCLGMFVPWANWKGAFSGLVTSVICMFSLGMASVGVGIRPVPLPVSEFGCSVSNLTLNSTFTIGLPEKFGLVVAASGTEGGIIELLKLSYQYYSLVGVIIVLVVGILVSAATGFTDPKSIDPKLLIPVYRICCCCLPKRWRDRLKCGIDFDEAIHENAIKADEKHVTESLLLTPPAQTNERDSKDQRDSEKVILKDASANTDQ